MGKKSGFFQKSSSKMVIFGHFYPLFGGQKNPGQPGAFFKKTQKTRKILMFFYNFILFYKIFYFLKKTAFSLSRKCQDFWTSSKSIFLSKKPCFFAKKSLKNWKKSWFFKKTSIFGGFNSKNRYWEKCRHFLPKIYKFRKIFNFLPIFIKKYEILRFLSKFIAKSKKGAAFAWGRFL